MGWAARANRRAIAAGEKTPAPKRPTAPSPPAGLVKRFINGLLTEHFGITGGARVKPPTRRQRYLQRVARRSTSDS